MPCGCEGHADNAHLCQYPALEALARELRQLVVEASYDWDSPAWQKQRREALMKSRHLTP